MKYLCNVEIKSLPWLLWLSGLSTGLQTKGSPVGFPVRAQARSPVETQSCLKRQPHLDVSLPLFLPPYL